MSSPTYNDSVFINCPFDDDYKPILRAIVYAIYCCGFYPQSALDEDDGTDLRLLKIIRKIKSCRFGIHDLSRIELNIANFPRFNMPFELGVFLGAKYYGDNTQKRKNALILEHQKYAYQQYISDLSGVDTKAHNNDPIIALKRVHSWLNIASRRKAGSGEKALQARFEEFEQILPDFVAKMGYNLINLPFLNLLDITQEFLADRPS